MRQAFEGIWDRDASFPESKRKGTPIQRKKKALANSVRSNNELEDSHGGFRKKALAEVLKPQRRCNNTARTLETAPKHGTLAAPGLAWAMGVVVDQFLPTWGVLALDRAGP